MRVPKSEAGVEAMRHKPPDITSHGGKGPKRPRRKHRLERKHRVKQFTKHMKRQRRT